MRACAGLSIVAMHGRAGRRCWHVAATRTRGREGGERCRYRECGGSRCRRAAAAARRNHTRTTEMPFATAFGCRTKSCVVNTRSVCGCCDPERLRNKIRVENYAVCDEAGSSQVATERSAELFSVRPDGADGHFRSRQPDYAVGREVRRAGRLSPRDAARQRCAAEFAS